MNSNPTNKTSNRLKNIFENLKADCFLCILFGNLERIKSLNIIKYNKNMQKRINININDYKKYFEIYSSIEIELIPKKNEWVNFINISNKENEKYYHIYFVDNKEETKQNYLNKEHNIKKIKITIDFKIKSLYALFYDCQSIESIKFKKFHRKDINNMSCMFYGCSSLKKIDFNNFNTENVADMHEMFFNCSSLNELNLKNFNTNNVTNMSYMFYYCSSLEKINLSNFNTNNVTNMSSMFQDCSSL